MKCSEEDLTEAVEREDEDDFRQHEQTDIGEESVSGQAVIHGEGFQGGSPGRLFFDAVMVVDTAVHNSDHCRSSSRARVIHETVIVRFVGHRDQVTVSDNRSLHHKQSLKPFKTQFAQPNQLNNERRR